MFLVHWQRQSLSFTMNSAGGILLKYSSSVASTDSIATYMNACIYPYSMSMHDHNILNMHILGAYLECATFCNYFYTVYLPLVSTSTNTFGCASARAFILKHTIHSQNPKPISLCAAAGGDISIIIGCFQRRFHYVFCF